jgi:anti-sigma factor RsiW
MNHQPYETWILDEKELIPDQKMDLLEHLEKCPKCSGLEKHWKAARQEVKSMPVVAAPADFSRRFHASLAERRRLLALQQTRVLLISLVSSGVAILITLAVFLLPHTSIVSVMVSLFTTFFKLINSVTSLWIFLSSMLRSAPTGFLVSVGVMISLLVSMVSVLWAVSFYRITMKGMKTVNEK